MLSTSLIRCKSVLLVSSLAILLGCSDSVEPRERLDRASAVILISLDTLRADYLNNHGYSDYVTSPFIDSLASESIVFENSIVVEPFTLTSHMSLLTGLYPQHHKVGRETPLPEGIDTLAAMMRRGGYSTQAYADGGWMRDLWGIDRGFDGYEGATRRGFRAVLSEATGWLEEHGSGKFFLFLHTYDVHNWGMQPYYRSPSEHRGMYSARFDSDLESEDKKGFNRRFREKSQLSDADKGYIRASYAECIRHVDAELERFFEFLKREGIYERALIILWSDHGEGLYDHVDWSHHEVYEHTIRSPLIMKIPGFEGGGRRVNSVVSAIDLVPTILELAGLPIPDTLDGRSILEYVFEDPIEGEAFSIEKKENLFSIRTPTRHLFLDGSTGRYHFFDLSNDPGETTNLSPSNSAEESRMRRRLAEWMREYEAAEAPGVVGEKLPLDAESKEQLRALGYAQ